MANFPKPDNPNVLAVAILEMCRVKKEESFCPSEVVKWIYPRSWQHFMDEVLEEMMILYNTGKIEVIQIQPSVPTANFPKGEVRIRAKI